MICHFSGLVEESAVGSSSSGTDVFKLTYLEGNSWLWDVSGVRFLVDFEHLVLKLICYYMHVIHLSIINSSQVEAGNGSKAKIQAAAGPVVGPQWQRPENG
ncbi:hypothetical protein V6N13_029437 [Hibiscus sabdariffa]|uniref:Uncharacterized protein n=1 Tax=Hibiscus sabdariffa TaxID=183260 RepID=A0ABR2BXK8_9ROSI